MLIILKSFRNQGSCNCAGRQKADKVLAFHDVSGKARTLPFFKPTTSRHANQMMYELETFRMYEGH